MSASSVHCWRPTDSLAPRLTTTSRDSPFESVRMAHCPSRMGAAIARRHSWTSTARDKKRALAFEN
eukprot:2001220-Prymnesium_polylepis.1